MSRFIVVEGIDGAGTTTQAKLLTNALESQGQPALYTFEPTDGAIGQLIRRRLKGEGDVDWVTMALLFAADRADHLSRVIEPALAAGKWVVSDRYDLSSLAYQSLTAPEPTTALAWIRELNAHARRPDLTLVLEVSATAADQRRVRRGADSEVYEKVELQARLADFYAKAEAVLPADTIKRVLGSGSIEEVSARVRQAVEHVG